MRPGLVAMTLAGASDLVSASMFVSSEDRAAYETFLSGALNGALVRTNAGPVGPSIDETSFHEALSRFTFESAGALPSLLHWVISQLEQGLVHVTHPRYFGLFNPAPAFAAECADRIVSAFNPQLASARTSPVAVAIEAHTIAMICHRIGFPAASGGHFTSGGSEANQTSVICALTRANPRFANEGIRSFSGPPILYVSAEAHLAWCKIVHQLGLGRDSLRLVSVDGAGRLDIGVLGDLIRTDRSAGRIPVLVAATAGTTGAGMVDPIAACAAVAAECGAWFHVDAAWGGALIASERLRGVLDALETSDSITIDGHKWFGTTMGCGMFLARDASVLSAAFTVDAGFMPSKDSMRDPYMTTAQWSRRFVGLRLFLSLATVGWQGYADHVERAVDLAECAKAELIRLGWRVVNRSPMAVVCAVPPEGGQAVRRIVERVVASNRAWVSVTTVGGEECVRLCISNGTTTLQDIIALAEILEIARTGQPSPIE